MNIIRLWTLTLVLAASVTFAAGSDQRHWLSYSSEHFRVHYPEHFQQWALNSVAILEQTRQQLQQRQYPVLDTIVDVFILDTFNDANGFALPLSNAPYMTLYTTPPGSDSLIADYDNWPQMLILHEYVHLIHLAQKPRSPWRKQLSAWWDWFDIGQNLNERWLAEGYATLQESLLTGHGRLYHDDAEALIQQFAREGALPSYRQLNGNDKTYLSNAMAYLLGARYMHWLQQKYGVAKLNAVWRRLKAVENRSFEQAFTGVFHDSAEHLYQRFVAEYTFNAMQKEQGYSASRAKLWFDLQGDIEAPALSPDNKMLALVERNAQGRSSLKVFSTEDNIRAKQRFTRQQQMLLAADPQDIADTPPEVFPRKLQYQLNPDTLHHQRQALNALAVDNPRWLDNDTLLYSGLSMDKQGVYHHDLFRWQLGSNQQMQLTHGGNIRRFDVAANGQYIIAERNQFGRSQLVKLDNDGTVQTELTTASIEINYDFPRLSPDSSHLAYVYKTTAQPWRLAVRNLSDGNILDIAVPQNNHFLSYPSWSADGQTLYFAAGVSGEVQLYRYQLHSGTLDALTNGQHPVSWPMATSDNRLLFLATNAKGPDVYELTLADNEQTANNRSNTSTSALTDAVAQLSEHNMGATAWLQPVHKAATTTTSDTQQPEDYGVGPQQRTLALGASLNSASENLLEIGIKGGDIRQRLAWQLNASGALNNNSLSGLSANLRWQGWPLTLLVHGYRINLNESDNGLKSIENKQRGLSLQLRYPWQKASLQLDTVVQLGRGQSTTSNGDNAWQRENYDKVGVEQSWYYDRQRYGLRQRAQWHWLSGTNAQQHWHGDGGSLNLAANYLDYGIALEYFWQYRDATSPLLKLGGYSSTLLTPYSQPNRLFEPALPFNSLAGNDYHGWQLYSPFRYGRLFYRRHVMRDSSAQLSQQHIAVYGVEGHLTPQPLFTGIANLVVDFGLARSKPESGQEDTRAWLSLSHQW